MGIIIAIIIGYLIFIKWVLIVSFVASLFAPWNDKGGALAQSKRRGKIRK